MIDLDGVYAFGHEPRNWLFPPEGSVGWDYWHFTRSYGHLFESVTPSETEFRCVPKNSPEYWRFVRLGKIPSRYRGAKNVYVVIMEDMR